MEQLHNGPNADKITFKDIGKNHPPQIPTIRNA